MAASVRFGLAGVDGLRRLDIGAQPAFVRVVVDRSAPPTKAAEIRAGVRNCLKLRSVAPAVGGFRVRGTELNLFEASFLLRVRDASGRVVGRRIATARGAWDLRVTYDVSRAQAGTVEAVAESARDGSLACLVQARVKLVA